jgi:hypothetical protein
MTGTRVILITASGPGGHVDIGVRADATPADLAGSIGDVLGVAPASASGVVAEHHAPPRPGNPLGSRMRLRPDTSLADSGVADGDMIIFRRTAGTGAAFVPRQELGVRSDEPYDGH